jgi:DMSO/TMAO reductase YedYZ molybdopterin-dependent catalytic subunit
MAVSAAIAGLGLGFVQVTAAREASPSASPPAAGDIQVSGHVANPGTLTIEDLQALPVETVDATYRSDDGTDVQHTYTGARLWDVLQLAQPAIEPELPESSLQFYLVLTARDGYVVVLSMGEIDPEFGGHSYLLAWEEDGRALSAEQGPTMLVPAGDQTEGRYIWGVVYIEVRRVDANTGT